MKPLNEQKNKKVPLIILGAALVVAVVALAAYLFFTKPSASQQPKDANSTTAPINSVDYSPPTEAEKQESDARKEEILKEQEQNQPAPSTTLQVSIIRASQDSPGAALNIRALVEGAKGGECQVQLSKTGQASINKTFPVAFEATSASCQGADIAASEFSATGEWTLKITARSDENQSNPVEQKVTIQK